MQTNITRVTFENSKESEIRLVFEDEDKQLNEFNKDKELVQVSRDNLLAENVTFFHHFNINSKSS